MNNAPNETGGDEYDQDEDDDQPYQAAHTSGRDKSQRDRNSERRFGSIDSIDRISNSGLDSSPIVPTINILNN